MPSSGIAILGSTAPTPQPGPASTPTPGRASTPTPGAASTPTPGPVATSTPGRATPKPEPTASPTPLASVVWQAGNATLGHWIAGNTDQCGTPIQTASQFAFTLERNGTSCGRNQANATNASGAAVRLTDGDVYAWTFGYIDGTPADTGPGMGPDSDADSLIWQIHGYEETDTPCTALNFQNGANGAGGAQMWALTDCNGIVWTGSYTPGEIDQFQIVAKISETSSGYIMLYRNGVLVASASGANYRDSDGDPWWNFGPYKWRWELADGGGSDMTVVNCTITNMLLTQQ